MNLRKLIITSKKVEGVSNVEDRRTMAVPTTEYAIVCWCGEIIPQALEKGTDIVSKMTKVLACPSCGTTYMVTKFSNPKFASI
jgi:hypothetical protein